MPYSIQSVCICGAGTMGSGIAQVAAQAGLHTILYDVNKTGLEKAKESIEKSLSLLTTRNKITQAERNETISRLRYTTDINDCIASIFIEAIVEDARIKAALFNQLNEVNHSEAIFATNTSSLSVSTIAEATLHPQRVVGMHFFNPAPVMKLVEVVKAKHTTDETVQAIVALAQQMGKTPVLCQDAPGFIVNHVARPYYLEALRLLQTGVPVDTIDALMEASGFKMGPFKLMDLIGNDINYTVSCSLYEALGQPQRLQPSPLQKEKVHNGQLGRKTGSGYYTYE